MNPNPINFHEQLSWFLSLPFGTIEARLMANTLRSKLGEWGVSEANFHLWQTYFPHVVALYGASIPYPESQAFQAAAAQVQAALQGSAGTGTATAITGNGSLC